MRVAPTVQSAIGVKTAHFAIFSEYAPHQVAEVGKGQYYPFPTFVEL